MGVPEMEALWNGLAAGHKDGTLNKDEETLYQKWGKALALLSSNPFHPSLNSHEIDALSHRYGRRVWESYLENRNSRAMRMFWVYGPDKGDITVIGLNPHPEDRKKDGYKKVVLSDL